MLVKAECRSRVSSVFVYRWGKGRVWHDQKWCLPFAGAARTGYWSVLDSFRHNSNWFLDANMRIQVCTAHQKEGNSLIRLDSPWLSRSVLKQSEKYNQCNRLKLQTERIQQNNDKSLLQVWRLYDRVWAMPLLSTFHCKHWQRRKWWNIVCQMSATTFSTHRLPAAENMKKHGLTVLAYGESLKCIPSDHQH